MSYRRFRIADLDLAPATVATLATFWSGEPQSVANVAGVAGMKEGSSHSDAQSVATVATVAGLDPWKANPPPTPFARDGPATVATTATVSNPGVRANAIVEAFRRLLERSPRQAGDGVQVMEHFLDQHLKTARQLGWTELELFGCYPDPTFALVRYDYMGVVTISALMAKPIATVTAVEIIFANELVSCRKPAMMAAAPVWQVFPAQ